MSEPTAGVRRIQEMLAGFPVDKRPVSELTPDEARQRTRTIWAEFWSAEPLRIESVVDHVVDTPQGPIRIRLYDPASDRSRPIFYFHGGGFVVGDLDTHDAIVRRLALYSGRPVVSTDYRRAPEHPYPQPLADCAAVVMAIVNGGSDIGLDASRFALAGDSAGANLALGTALRLRDAGIKPVALLSLIGNFDPFLAADSYRRYGSGYGLTSAEVGWFWRQYLGGLLSTPPADAAPLLADLTGLPPTFVGAAECDPVRGDSDALVTRLAEAGVPAEFRLWEGMIHGCCGMARELNQADAQMADAAVWLARHLA